MAYTPIWQARRNEILLIAEEVRFTNPTAWAEVKVPGQTSRKYIILVVEACQSRLNDKVVNGITLRGQDVGCNLKRGGQELSLDVIALPNPTGARDATGRFPGLELIDIIGSAESAGAFLSWIDVTQITIDRGEMGGWVDVDQPASPAPRPPAGIVPGREEALDEMNWLDAYYAAPEGLQRPTGLSKNGKPDFEGISAWYLDIYQQERMKGASRDVARAAYVNQIRRSAEWQAKHPGETP